ncbi:hypothetical protein AGMMS50262_13000 [Bacteroidia bacterium]|nr:hypothetical protein AGMMS50262_13000 [Bacteroidia bacterium]
MKQIGIGAMIIAAFLFPPEAWGQDIQLKKDSLHQVLTKAEGKDLLKAYQKLTGLYFAEAVFDDLKRDTLLALYDRMTAEAKKQSNAHFLGTAYSDRILAYNSRRQSEPILKLAPGYLDELTALEEMRTKYETDKHIAETQRNRNYFLFVLGGCILLALALGINIYYSRKIARKNRIMAGQIKELQLQQSLHDEELLRKTVFEPAETPDDEGFCPESRRDKLCIAIRDRMLKEKIYRNPLLSGKTEANRPL